MKIKIENRAKKPQRPRIQESCGIPKQERGVSGRPWRAVGQAVGRAVGRAAGQGRQADRQASGQAGKRAGRQSGRQAVGRLCQYERDEPRFRPAAPLGNRSSERILKSTGSVYSTRTSAPSCLPGVHRGARPSTRATASENCGCGDSRISTIVIRPSLSTTNAATTRPCTPRFSMSDGYLTSAITQLRNLSSPPPKNFGMTSTTR